MHSEQPEISDLVIAYDPETLERLPVGREQVLGELEQHGMARGVQIVSRWPHRGGVLDPDHVDRVLLTAHHELTRLSEEFMQGRRMQRILRPLLGALRLEGVPGPYRIVDIGCGIGFVTRWLAARGKLGDDVELWGCDYNAGLVRFAQSLADEERLPCRFVVANAFKGTTPAAIYISTGVIHHFRGAQLSQLMQQQAAAGPAAFVHADIKPSYLAPLGSWIFHQARMREPLARHDGVLSALRAHPGERLLRVSKTACPGYAAALFDGERELVPILKVMQMLVGIRRDVVSAFRRELGPLVRNLSGLD